MLSDKVFIKPNSDFMRMVVGFLKNKHSPILVICGRTRGGKSIMGIQVARMIAKHAFDKIWFPEYKINVLTDVQDLLKQLELQEKTIFVIDESIKHFGSSDYWSLFNQAFMQMIATQGFRNNAYILIIPKFRRLAAAHRDMVDFKLIMRKRGIASPVYLSHDYGGERKDIDEVRQIKLKEYITVPMPPPDVLKAYNIIEKLEKDKILHEWQLKIKIEERKIANELKETDIEGKPLIDSDSQPDSNNNKNTAIRVYV